MDITELEGYVGADIGGQSIKIGTFRDGVFISKDFVTPPDYPAAREQMIAVARELAGGKPKGFGIGSPGPLDWRKGYLPWTPNIPWKHIYYTEMGNDLGCPVFVDNDANVAGLAESVLGAGRGYDIAAGFTLGTGIGFFTIKGGHIYHGREDVEGGHQMLNPEGPECTCGSRGCLESFISAWAIRKKTGKDPDQIDDPKFWAEIAYFLAWGITNVNALVCPEIFVLCGGMIQRGDMLMTPLHIELDRMCKIMPPAPIKLAELGTRAGVYGAIVLARLGHSEKNEGSK